MCILTYEHAYFRCFLVRKLAACAIKGNLYTVQDL